MTDFEPNLETSPLPKIPLPQGWSDLVLFALLHVIALARIALLNARNWPGRFGVRRAAASCGQ